MIKKLLQNSIEFTDKSKKLFDSKEEMLNFAVKQIEQGNILSQYTLTSRWEEVLSLCFGERDWREGIRDDSYNTTANGWYASYSGSLFHEDCGVKVKGVRADGDAYYADDGCIIFEFDKSSETGLKQARKQRISELNSLIKKSRKEKERLEKLTR